ncbi:MAG: OsmC family protein [Chitinophagales bacterium]|nr:OsmC family protein [Chitinophagales bacterium]
METHYYDVTVEWTSDRKGTMSSPVLFDSIEVATPPQFNKGIEGIWSPEHLLVAAINSCLMTTFLAIAENSKLEFSSFKSEAIGKLEAIEGKYMISEVTLKPEVWVTDGQLVDKALRLLQKAEANCLISNSVKSNILFEPRVKISETANP